MCKDNRSDFRAGLDDGGDVYHQRVAVPFDYPVHFTRGVFREGSRLLADVLERRDEDRRHRAAVYVDSGVSLAHPGLLGRIKEYFHERAGRLELAANPEVLPGGEAVKSGWKIVRDVMTAIGNLHLDRHSFVIAIGGGSLLDMVGFATSIVHRGLRLVRLPTTTLGQCDAGVGVKNGMNEHGQKNFVGTFAPPFAVINDFDFLPTLSQEHWLGGVAEAFKVALIKDGPFFNELCGMAEALAARDGDVMEKVVRRCAILHLEHIRSSGDPFEFGSARPLDFGHWSAHRLETQSRYRLGHGQSVSIGIALDSYYAMVQKLISKEDLKRILDAMVRCGLPIWSPHLAERSKDGRLLILDGLDQFREHLGGLLTITLPDSVGGKCEVHHVDPSVLEMGVEFLRSRAENGPG